MPSVPPNDGGGPTADQLREALKAFKKRIKLAKLEDESRLSGRALSKGGSSNIVAVQPPAQFPKAVWEELVKQGRLRYAGSGLYQLVNPTPDR
jgi:hypothetical protein